MRKILASLALCVGMPLGASSARAQGGIPPCAADTSFATLDFWLGDWDVYVGTKLAGTNHIEKVLSGCAVTEDWTGASGAQGRSLFYYIPAERTWNQVWVTENALARGGVKEKTLIERFPGGGVRFQGEIRLAEGGSYLDRTTLTPIENGDVRQVIEVSTDGGKTWRSVFDARYTRKQRGN